MTIRVYYDPTQGLVQKDVAAGQEGVALAGAAGTTGIAPYALNKTSHSINATLSAAAAGVHMLSGTAAITVALPNATGSVGALFTFVADSAHAHIVTASQDTPGTTPIANGANHGSSYTLENLVGTSVALQSDGINWVVLGTSNTGSLA